MGKSNHKNFIEGYGRKRRKIIKYQIIPYQDRIFDSFSNKFELDAKADGNRGRKKLEQLGLKCAENCKSIHEILSLTTAHQQQSEDTTLIVNNIINMDYGSVKKFFKKLKKRYKKHPQIYKLLDETKDNVGEMRRISKKHTNIIKN